VKFSASERRIVAENNCRNSMSREMLSKTVNNVFSTFAGQKVNFEKNYEIVHSNKIVVIAKRKKCPRQLFPTGGLVRRAVGVVHVWMLPDIAGRCSSVQHVIEFGSSFLASRGHRGRVEYSR